MEKVSRGTMAWVIALALFANCLSASGASSIRSAGPYMPPPGCPAEPLTLDQDLARRRPNEARYPVCVDQRALLADAREQARRQGKLVLIHFGAPWCPVCRGLPGELAALRQIDGDREVTSALAGVVEVALSVSVIVDRKRHEIADTHSILAEVSARPNVEPLRAIPYIVLMAPDMERVVGRNLDDLQDGSYARIEPVALGRALDLARRHIIDGTPPPTSAGWVARKLRKLGF